MIRLDSASDPGSAFIGLLVIAALIALYFLPTIIAVLRHHHNTPMITILNFFLGWTCIGWIIFLAMAFSNPAPAVFYPPTDRR